MHSITAIQAVEARTGPAATPPTVDAAALAKQLRERGFVPGLPSHVAPASLVIDARVVRHLRCPHCRNRRMVARFFLRHAPKGYAVLAVCSCGHGEEV